MLGNDDIDVLIDEPISAADLFGEDEEPLRPSSPSGEQDGDEPATDGAAQATEEATAEGEAKKVRRINRLPNLNEKWIADPKKEGLYAVNKYFEKKKLDCKKGRELETLKSILRTYEYWAQQCYPKFCFGDFVNKVESLTGKKLVKAALLDIRSDRNIELDAIDDDMAPIDFQADPVGNSNFQQQANEGPATSFAFDPFSSPAPPISASSPAIGEDMKEIIRRKREEAIARRKRKLEESLNSSSTVCQADNNSNITLADMNSELNSSVSEPTKLNESGAEKFDDETSTTQGTIADPIGSSTPGIGDDMREIIRKKREEALAKKRRKIDVSSSLKPVVEDELEMNTELEESLKQNALQSQIPEDL